MYEKLDKMRDDLKKARRKQELAEKKVKDLEGKLREAENQQILASVGALHLSPEQLSEFLALVAGGQLPTRSVIGEASFLQDPERKGDEELSEEEELKRMMEEEENNEQNS